MLPLIIFSFSGLAWIIPNTGLLAPLMAPFLVPAVALASINRPRFAVALDYYLIGSVSIIGAIKGFYGPH